MLGADKAGEVWSTLEVVGDIAVLKKPFSSSLSIEDYRALALELMKSLPYIKSVWLAVSPTEPPFKTRRLVHLAGEERTVTTYREHGCIFKVDIARVFITPRLSFEHARVASLVEPGEVVVNMFAGVGTFSIIIAKRAQARLVHSIDINEHAYKLMLENIELNKVSDRVVAHLGDAARVVEEKLVGVADRVLMPLPDLALEYAPYALKALRGDRGWVHFYLHVPMGKRGEHLAEAEKLVSARLEELGWRARLLRSRTVRKVGPRLAQVVVDTEAEARS
ncbi:MAG: class I SAM-dependent methyltransferase family protein [Acidilobaceae archaeon]